MRSILLSIFIFSLCSTARSQVTLYGSVGEMINIHPQFPHVDRGGNLELTYDFPVDHSKHWFDAYNAPEVGVSLSYSTLGNPKVLGNAVTCFPYVEVFKRFSDRASLSLRPGMGFAWFDSPFDAIDNPENLVIGSRWTAAATIRMNFRYKFADRWSGLAGFALWHYSNGHLSVPNIGANIPYLSLGVRCHFEEDQEPVNPEAATATKIDKGIRYNVHFGLGWHEIEGTVYPWDGPRYPVYSGSFYVSKRTSIRSRFSAGLHWNYYTAFTDYIRSQEVFREQIGLRSSKVIIFVGHEFMFGRVGVNTMVGMNAYYPLRPALISSGVIDDRWTDRLFSARIGFNYYFNSGGPSTEKSPFISLSLHTIGGKADFLGVGVGFTL